MSSARRHGCPMCGIISAASRSSDDNPHSSGSSSSAPDVLWKDDHFTVYRETAHPVSSKGHVVVLFNQHIASMYMLSSSDISLLEEIKDIALRVLQTEHRDITDSAIRVGFITPPFKDSKIPVTDHLHAHAYIAPNDLCGWWRAIQYGPLAWYPIDDLVAEIRESTSNNRVRSGYRRPSVARDRTSDVGGSSVAATSDSDGASARLSPLSR